MKNVASPGGVNGLAEVAAAQPDGRTLLFTNTNVALLPALGEKLPFDPKDAFSHLGLVLESPMVVLGRPSLEATTSKELADWLVNLDARSREDVQHLGYYLFAEWLGPQVRELLARWVPVFDKRVDPVELRLRAAAVVISLATGPYRGQETDWRQQTVAMVRSAGALVRQVVA